MVSTAAFSDEVLKELGKLMVNYLTVDYLVTTCVAALTDPENQEAARKALETDRSTQMLGGKLKRLRELVSKNARERNLDEPRRELDEVVARMRNAIDKRNHLVHGSLDFQVGKPVSTFNNIDLAVTIEEIASIRDELAQADLALLNWFATYWNKYNSRLASYP